jgi:hypothetical protein
MIKLGIFASAWQEPFKKMEDAPRNWDRPMSFCLDALNHLMKPNTFIEKDQHGLYTS